MNNKTEQIVLSDIDIFANFLRDMIIKYADKLDLDSLENQDENNQIKQTT